MLSFGLERNELSGFQIPPKTTEKIKRIVYSGDSIFFGSTISPDYLLVKKKDFEIFKAGLENEYSKTDSILNIKEMELTLKSDSVKSLRRVVEQTNTGIKNNAEFDLDGQLLFRLPYWAIGFLAIFLGGLIYISLRFFSLHFQEVSMQEQLSVITNDFDLYKKNTIEKERKLVRDLIDSKNRIEELNGELRK